MEVLEEDRLTVGPDARRALDQEHRIPGGDVQVAGDSPVRQGGPEHVVRPGQGGVVLLLEDAVERLVP